MVSRVNGLYAAKTIEDADPSFKNSLLNYLTLRGHRDGISKSFLAAVEAKAVKDLTRVEIDTVVDQRRLLQMFYALAGVVVVFCLYSAVTPKSILDSTRRAFLADVVRPTNTRLDEHQAGRPRRAQPGRLRVRTCRSRVDTPGDAPRRVMLHYSVDGGKYFMTSEFAPGANYYDPWQTTLRDVRQSMEYYLTGGDAESLQYHLKVLPAPMVTAVSVDYEFPSVYGRPRRARTSKGARSRPSRGRASRSRPGPTSRPSRPTSTSARARTTRTRGWRSRRPTRSSLVGSFEVKESGTYTIKFKTTGRPGEPRPGRLRHQGDPRQGADRGRVPPPRQARDQRPGQRPGPARDDGRRRLRRQGGAAERPRRGTRRCTRSTCWKSRSRPGGSGGRSRSTWPRRRSSRGRSSNTS